MHDQAVGPASVTRHFDQGYTVAVPAHMLRYIPDAPLSKIAPHILRIVTFRETDSWWVKIELKREAKCGWRALTRARLNAMNWAQPWSVKAYLQEALHVGATKATNIVADTKKGTYSFALEIEGDPAVFALLLRLLDTQASLATEIEKRLEASIDRRSVVTHFQFPSDVRSACEQYLLHFADFLRDLGVDVTTELKELANEVLFSVTPKDERHALELIERALAVYLNLPQAELSGVPANITDEIATRKLEMNIFHLKSQLAAAEAKATYLAASVEAQRHTIDILKLFTPPESELRRLIAAENDRPEPLVGDIVAITKFSKGPFTIDLPHLLRRLKRMFDSTHDPSP